MGGLQKRPKSFTQITLQVSIEAEDAAATALLELGAVGTASEQLPGRDQGSLTIRGYFIGAQVPSEQIILQWIAKFCPPGVHVPDHARIEALPWRDWAAESQRSFHPHVVAPDLVIAPPWDLPARAPDQSLLILQPGAAFGLGTHATTRGCILLMPAPEDRRTAGACLDVGTGSAVLALRAAQLGYRPVLAFDHDPAAVASAAQNLRLNQLEDRVWLFVGEADALRRQRRYDLILANLFLNPLLSLAADLSARLTDRGRLVVSGIREEDADQLRAALQAQELFLEDTYSAEGWTALRMGRRTSDDAQDHS